MTYPEYDYASDRYYRVVYVGAGQYKRDFAPFGFKPTDEERAEKARLDELRAANERWLSKSVDPLMRQRRFRVIGWIRGLRRAPSWTRKYR